MFSVTMLYYTCLFIYSIYSALQNEYDVNYNWFELFCLVWSNKKRVHDQPWHDVPGSWGDECSSECPRPDHGQDGPVPTGTPDPICMSAPLR